ncbi:MAG: GspH/FimT family pseudopilin [Candidatus Berkiellales bacterium]
MFNYKFKGITLLELLICIAILSILLTLGIPTFSSFLQKQAIQNDLNTLFHVLQFARSEAIKRQTLIGICGSENLSKCDGNWSFGYIVYITDEKNSLPFSQKILRIHQNHPNTIIRTGKREIIQYQGNGRCLTNDTLSIGSEEKIEKTIVIARSGRARVAKP